MESEQAARQGINTWLEDELLEQYRRDKTSVDPLWKSVFDRAGNNGHAPAAHPVPNQNGVKPIALPILAAGDELQPLRGTAARIAENMAAGTAVPLATSQRIIPVKVIDENRRLINHHRGLIGKSKVSYTHIIGWAIVRSVQANPGLNHSFAMNASGELFRVVKNQINFGLAVDVAGKNGARSLVVPSIKNAGAMSFLEYLAAFDDLVARARANKLGVPDFQGTTISLTNPGTV
ncbi:MAG TPA: 2-oxo acid dehydrogenase subunit E2, partial [Bryobacteraceae bacterium]|nr:2-oxo acid dehydrogenase subunit E2 [Bryobacteraceae bacterium]